MSVPISKICAVALTILVCVASNSATANSAVVVESAESTLQQVEKSAPDISNGEYEAPLDDAPPLVAVGQWQISAALGYGQRSNVLLGEDDFDIYLIPSIKYYGESFFFENGTLGFTLNENANQAWSVVAELNPYVAQFYDSHLDNFFAIDNLNGNSLAEVPTLGTSSDFTEDLSEGPLQPADGPEREYIQQITLNKPDWSVDLGIQHNWFFDNGTSLISQLFTDVSSEHQGHRFEWLFSGSFSTDSSQERRVIGQWHGMWQLGVSIMDDKSSQYYFGIDERHTDIKDIYYQTDWAFNPLASITLFYPLNENMRLVGFAKYQHLDDTIYQSPKVNEHGISTFYFGVAYDF